MTQKPPDLDENLNPIKPPDLDGNGDVIGEETDNSPQMTFAIVNGQRIPLGGDESDIIPRPELTRETEPEVHPGISLVERLMTPIVDVSPETRQHMAEFEQEHPILGGIGRTGLDFILGESSPLSLGLGLAGAAETAASRAGMNRASQLLRIPSRVAGAGMMYHGLERVGEGETLGDKLGGGLETALGGLAVRGPKNISTVERLNKLTRKPGLIDELYEQNPTKSRLNKLIVSDPLGEGANPNPRLTREIPISPSEMQFHYNLRGRLNRTFENVKEFGRRFIADESGSFKLPDIKGQFKTTRPLRALDELHDALIDASGVREETEKLYKGERSRRFSDYESVTSTGRKGFYEGLSRLKGKYPKGEFSPIEMNRNSARALYNEIKRRTDLSVPDRIHAETGLGKILGDYKAGEIPQRHEIEAMRKVFGDPVADQLMQLHAGIPITKEALNEVANLSKSVMSSMDASAPFRQGLGLVHTREFWQNYKKMYSYLGRGAYDAAMESINKDPLFSSLEKAGLQITEIGKELGRREEQFASKLAEKIPGIPASERMYTGFLNKTRFDVAKRLMMEAERAGLKPFVKNSAGEIVPTKLGKEIASYVNNATGRGSLGRFEKNAVELNTLFFSPRLISSRLTMLNPAYYYKADPFVRKQALKSLFAIATAGKIVESLGQAAGGTIETADKTSSDYHKVRIGNVRIDPYGGFQQYIVAANRLLAGVANTAMGNEEGMQLKTAFDRTFTGGRFASFTENKLSPVAKFVDDIVRGRPAENTGSGSAMDIVGIPHRPIDAKILNLVTPMMIQDLADLMKEDPSLIPLSLLSSQGMGVQTYQPAQQQNNAGFRQLVR